MAAFTTFEISSLERYLRMFQIGDLESCEPIEDGIENSNYFVTVNLNEERSVYILTIIEGFSFDDLPFFNSVMRHLFYYGLPVAAPRQTMDGMTTTIFCGKPALLFPRLSGKHLTEVGTGHCFLVGKTLANMHVTLATQDLNRENPFTSQWMEESLREIDIANADKLLLRKVADEYELAQDLELPKGIIHGDLFRDNVLFNGDELTGILDFYHACHDFLVQDIAVCINDWCQDGNGGLDNAKRDALINGYHEHRPLSASELEYLPHFQKFAAARFTLTRLLSGEPGTYLKNPGEFLQLLRYYEEEQSGRKALT